MEVTMKTKMLFIFMVVGWVLLFINTASLAQETKWKKEPSEKIEIATEKIERNVYINLGAGGGFSSGFSKPALIPKIGLDASFGMFGFRIDGQTFNTSPEFDYNRYLDPIRSVLTVSVQKANNTNTLLGITPYLNFGTEAFTIQPAVGIKYLMQNGTSVLAEYKGATVLQVIKFPEGDAKRNVLMIEPHIRATFGRPGNFLGFYVEAAYNIPVGGNEYTFTTRDLTGVVQDGRIITDRLLKSNEVKSTTNTIPNYFTFGFGIAVNLTHRQSIPISGLAGTISRTREEEKPQNDEQTDTTNSGQTGIFVPHAKVLIELLPGEKGTINTNEKGQFAINFSDLKKIQGENSAEIRIRFTIMPDQNVPFNCINNIIETTLSKADGPFFVFTLKSISENSDGSKCRFEVIHIPQMRQGNQSGQGGGKGAKQGKDPAVKTGDSYQGEVRHF